MESLRALPSVDGLLRDARIEALSARHGRSVVTDAIRTVLATVRDEMTTGGVVIDEVALLDRIALEVQSQTTPSLRRVFNLTGTILHTNLGRAPLPTKRSKRSSPRPASRVISSSTSRLESAATATTTSKPRCAG